jgi:hypothetical protein
MSALVISGIGWRDVTSALAQETVYTRSTSCFLWQSQV